MDNLTPQRVLEIYASLTANEQIERFSARNQAVLHSAANAAALFLWNLERWGADEELPRFGSFAIVMLVGPDGGAEDTEEDLEDARIERTIASDNVPMFHSWRARHGAAAAEAARAAAEDEREEDN